MRLFKLKAFVRFQRREKITDKALAKAVQSVEKGLVDAILGGELIKQRVARPGQGKSGGFRTIIAYRQGTRAIFLYGFAKSELQNLDDDELAYWQQVGRIYLRLDDKGLEAATAADELTEIDHDEDD